MGKTAGKKPDARQRILETAEQLFYAQGLRAVGIDRIIAEAGVAKMTLYNHFPSKDDLILAVLEHREQQVNQMFEKSIKRHVNRGKNRLDAFFAALKDWFDSPGFRGCSFINASVELADGDHPASRFSAAHKERLGGMIREIVIESGGRKAASVAEAIGLLVEGATVSAVMQQSCEPAEVAHQAALALLGRSKRR